MQRQSRRMGSRTEWGTEWELGSREKVSGKGLGSQEMGLATESEMGLGKGSGSQEMGLGTELGMGSEMGLGTEWAQAVVMQETWEGGEHRRGCL